MYIGPYFGPFRALGVMVAAGPQVGLLAGRSHQGGRGKAGSGVAAGPRGRDPNLGIGAYLYIYI